MTTGDYFNIIVATHTGQVVACNPTATDGSQEPASCMPRPMPPGRDALHDCGQYG